MGKSMTKNPAVAQRVPSGHGSPKSSNTRVVRPRDQAYDLDDPYIPDRHYPDDTVCSRCGAVVHNQHWTFDEERRNLLQSAGAVSEVICPGCKIVAERNPERVVTLHGDYWPQHRDDILNLIRNEERRGMNTNPL